MKTITQMRKELFIQSPIWLTEIPTKISGLPDDDIINRIEDKRFLFGNVFESYTFRMALEVYGKNNYMKYKVMNMYFPYFKRYVEHNIDNREFGMDLSRPQLFDGCLNELSNATTMMNRINKINHIKQNYGK